jgi:hydrogenase maturation factor HypF (carbamoyltransferase family)
MTEALYHCPDCNRIHDDPADALYALLVVCTNCALERELAAFAQASQADFVQAA